MQSSPPHQSDPKVIVKPPVIFHMDSRQQAKRTFIKNVYAKASNNQASKSPPRHRVVEDSQELLKPSQTDQQIPQSVLDQMSSQNKTISDSNKVVPQSLESLKPGAEASQLSKSSRAEQSMQSNKASSRRRGGDSRLVNENKELNVVVNPETTSIPDTETAN